MALELLNKYVDELILDLVPICDEEIGTEDVVDWIKSSLLHIFGANTFETGASLNKVLLPDETVELTQLLPKKQCLNWCFRANEALCNDKTKAVHGSRESLASIFSFSTDSVNDFNSLSLVTNENVDIESVSCFPKRNYLTAVINDVSFRVSPNNLTSLFISAIFEEFDDFIGSEHLLKRSLLLIKAWCNYDSLRFSCKALCDVFSPDALAVMTICLFSNRPSNLAPIDHPLGALVYFLEEYSTLDWENFSVSASQVKSLKTCSSPGYGSGGQSRTNSGQLSIPENNSTLTNHFYQSLPETKFKIKCIEIVEKYKAKYQNDFICEDFQLASSSSLVESILTSSSSGSILDGGSNSLEPTISPNFKKTRTNALSISKSYFRVLSPINDFHNLCEHSKIDQTNINAPNEFNDVVNTLKRGLEDFTNQISPLLSSKRMSSNFDAPLASFRSSPYDSSLNKLKHVVSQLFPQTSNRVSALKKIRNINHDLSNDFSYINAVDSNDILQKIQRNKRNNINGTYSLFGPSNDSNHPDLEDKRKLVKMNQLKNNLTEILSIIRHAETVSSIKITADTILNLVLQVLNQSGPLPIGEIGKQLQQITGNQNILKILKQNFSGLKRFISSYPTVFKIGDNHNYNPRVYIIGKHNIPISSSSSHVRSKSADSSNLLNSCTNHNTLTNDIPPITISNLNNNIEGLRLSNSASSLHNLPSSPASNRS